MADNTPVPVGVPQTPTKAILAALGGFISTLVVGIAAANPDTFQEWLVVVLAALGGSLVSGFPTYRVPNKAKGSVAVVRHDVGAASLITVIVGVVIGIFLIWLVLVLVGHHDNNGGHGNDWERHPAATGVLR